MITYFLFSGDDDEEQKKVLSILNGNFETCARYSGFVGAIAFLISLKEAFWKLN